MRPSRALLISRFNPCAVGSLRTRKVRAAPKHATTMDMQIKRVTGGVENHVCLYGKSAMQRERTRPSKREKINQRAMPHKKRNHSHKSELPANQKQTGSHFQPIGAHFTHSPFFALDSRSPKAITRGSQRTTGALLTASACPLARSPVRPPAVSTCSSARALGRHRTRRGALRGTHPSTPTTRRSSSSFGHPRCSRCR